MLRVVKLSNSAALCSPADQETKEGKMATRRCIDMIDLTGDAVEATGGSAEVVDVTEESEDEVEVVGEERQVEVLGEEREVEVLREQAPPAGPGLLALLERELGGARAGVVGVTSASEALGAW